jgi:hypothetical protein
MRDGPMASTAVMTSSKHLDSTCNDAGRYDLAADQSVSRAPHL